MSHFENNRADKQEFADPRIAELGRSYLPQVFIIAILLAALLALLLLFSMRRMPHAAGAGSGTGQATKPQKDQPSSQTGSGQEDTTTPKSHPGNKQDQDKGVAGTSGAEPRPNPPSSRDTGQENRQPANNDDFGSELGGGAGESAEPPPGESNEGISSAIAEAKKLKAKAEQAAKAGRYKQAYQHALEAWKKTRGMAAKDSEAGQLKAELDRLLEQYGEAANEAHSGKRIGEDKPLIIK